MTVSTGERMAQCGDVTASMSAPKLHRDLPGRAWKRAQTAIGGQEAVILADGNVERFIVVIALEVGAIDILSGNKTHQLTVTYCGGAAVDAGAGGVGQADEEHIHAGGRGDDLCECGLCPIEDNAVGDEVKAGAAGEVSSGKTRILTPWPLASAIHSITRWHYTPASATLMTGTRRRS